MTIGSSSPTERANGDRADSRRSDTGSNTSGRPEDLVRRFGLRVVQQAQREEERVDALLFDGESRLLLDAPQRAIECFRLEASSAAPCPGARRAATPARRARRCAPRSHARPRRRDPRRRRRVGRNWRVRSGCVPGVAEAAAACDGGERQRLLLVVQQAIDLGRLLVDDRDRGDLQGPEVQGPVAARQVEQLPLPGVERRVDDRLHGLGSGHGGILG